MLLTDWMLGRTGVSVTAEEAWEHILQHLRVVAQAELDCELKRAEIVGLEGFSPILLYEQLCRDRSLGVSTGDLIEFLRSFRFEVSHKDLTRVFEWFDFDHDGHLNFKEWEGFLDLQRSGFSDQNHLVINQELADRLAELIDVEISACVAIGTSLSQLHRCCSANQLLKFFGVLDKNSSGFIELEVLHHALESHDNFISSKAAARRIIKRFDRDYDEAISYQEYLQALQLETRPRKSQLSSPTKEQSLKAQRDVITVIENSPTKIEKRVYVIERTSDGQIAKEERVYEELPRSSPFKSEDKKYTLYRELQYIERGSPARNTFPEFTSPGKPLRNPAPDNNPYLSDMLERSSPSQKSQYAVQSTQTPQKPHSSPFQPPKSPDRASATLSSPTKSYKQAVLPLPAPIPTRKYVELCQHNSAVYGQRDKLSGLLSPEHKYSILDAQTQGVLGKHFCNVFGLNSQLEVKRRELAELPQIGTADLWRLWTQGKTLDRAVFTGISAALGDLLHPSWEEFAPAVFTRADKDLDKKLAGEEFCELFLPVNPEIRERRENHTMRAFEVTSIEEIDKTARRLLADILNLLIQIEEEVLSCDAAAQSLLYSWYNLVDKSAKSVLTITDLTDYLHKHHSSPSQTKQHDVIALLRWFDCNLDGKISLSEFTRAWTSPLQTQIA